MEISAFHERHYGSSLSCNREEAVARMLGIIVGHVNSFNPEYALENLSPESLNDAVNAAQQALCSAYDRFDDATATDEEVFDLIVKEDAVKFNDEIHHKAQEARAALARELAKGSASEVLLDQANTDIFGEDRIWIDTLEKWSAKNYPYLRLMYESGKVSGLAVFQQAETRQASDSKIGKSGELGRKQRKAIVEAVRALGHDPKAVPKEKSGTKGLRGAVRVSLKRSGLFGGGEDSFRKAWEKAFTMKLLTYSKGEPSPSDPSPLSK